MLKTFCHDAGRAGIGHVRYPTAGTPSAQEAQPFFVNSPLGIFLIHNGNITNAAALREGLNSSDSFFNRHLRTDSDSEVSARESSAMNGLLCLRTITAATASSTATCARNRTLRWAPGDSSAE